MRNLKRALSLLLAAAMLIGMMVVGASAAGSLDDFSDKDEIVNQDAVSLLTILGVIEGKEDGSYFDPTGNVTRAEMAKMIATILNQGADVAGLYTGMNTGLTDVSGHWAESYINYCYSLGIIAGRGNGTFDPGANVTGTEAAKMLLVAAGYDASIEGMEGADWAIRTAALASTLGIFDNLTAPTGDPLNRDNAALLVYNALDVEMIQRYDNGYAIVYGDSRTLLSTKYGVYRIEGVVVGNEWAQLENTDSDAALAAGKTRLSEVVLIDSDTVNTIDNTDDGTPQPDTTFNVSTPVEYLGQTVTMYVRNTTVLANSQVLGVYLKDGVNNVLTTAESQDTMKDYLKGTGLSTDGDTQYYVNYGVVATEAAGQEALSFNSGRRFDNVKGNTSAYGVEMTVIDNNDDGIVDYVLWLQETLTQVTAINTANETTVFNAINGNRTIDNEDIVTEADLAEGDLELLVSYGGRYYVSDPEVITGEMEAYEASRTEEQTITVSGTEYNPSYIVYKAESADNTYEFNIRECDDGLDGVQFDTTYDFILDSNGNVIAYQPSEQGLYNYALILESGYEPGAFASDASGKVTVLLPDGTKGTYELNFSASAKNVGEQIDKDNYTTSMGIAELKGFLGTSDSDNSSTAPWKVDGVFTSSKKADGTTNADQYDFPDGMAVGYVVGYSLNDNNVMTITSIVGSNTGDDPKVSEYNGGYDEALYSDYSEMANVEDGVPFVANYVDNVRSQTDLASVVLFRAEGVRAEKDYVFVLNASDVDSSRATLTVVFENGEVGELTIDGDDYDDIFRGKDEAFRMVYAYTTDSDGVSELTAPVFHDNKATNNGLSVAYGYAWQVNTGTIALYEDEDHTRLVDTYSYDEQIWYTENTDEDDTSAPAGSFTTNTGREVVLVLDGDGDTVVAAFIERILSNEGAPGFVGDADLPDPVIELSGATSRTRIEEAFDDGYSVLIDDNYTLTADLRIPRGRGLQVTGNLDLNGHVIDNTGLLIVNDELLTGGPITLTGTIYAGSMTLEGAATISGTVSVTNNLNADNNSITINENHALNVDGNIVNGPANNPNGITVNGGELNVDGNVSSRVVAKNNGSVTINGNLTGALSITNGDVEIGGNYSGDVGLSSAVGSLTVGGNFTNNNGTPYSDITVGNAFAMDVTGDLTTAADITVTNSKTLEVGGTLTVVNVTVDAGATLDVGALNATTVDNDGTLIVGGNLVATTVTTDGDLDVAGNITATTLTLNEGELTATDINATLDLVASSAGTVLNLNGDATIGTTANLGNKRNLTINLGARSELTLDSSTAAVNLSWNTNSAVLDAQVDAEITISYTASNAIRLPVGVTLDQGGTSVPNPINAATYNGTYTYNGTIFEN